MTHALSGVQWSDAADAVFRDQIKTRYSVMDKKSHFLFINSLRFRDLFFLESRFIIGLF